MRTTHTFNYRGCQVWQNAFDQWEWQHPSRVDYDPETGAVWAGWGTSPEECIDQINDEYEDRLGQ